MNRLWILIGCLTCAILVGCAKEAEPAAEPTANNTPVTGATVPGKAPATPASNPTGNAPGAAAPGAGSPGGELSINPNAKK